MASQKFSAGDIQGFTPAIDPTSSDKVFVLGGDNYVFDLRGPRSVFGNRLLLPQQRQKPEYIQGCRINLVDGERVFTFDGDGIWEWNETVGGFECLYLTPDTTQSPYRWTHAYLNGYVYFCHPRTGILAYNVSTGFCTPHSNIGLATPVNAIALVENNGRLCVIDPIYFSWSNPADGTDFTPQLGGGGLQKIADRIGGAPVMITSYTQGCLTWTTGGVLRSEFTGDAFVFQHRSLNTEYTPCNSFCTARLDDNSVIILDERGLFQSKGQSPAALQYNTDAPTGYSPAFNEFLKEYIRENKLTIGQNLRIEWDEKQRLLYVMTSLTYALGTYEQTFVYYPALDKWGQLTTPVYGVFPIGIGSSEREGDFYGFADANGRVRFWLNTGSVEAEPVGESQLNSDNLYYPAIDKPLQYSDSNPGIIASATGKASGFTRQSPLITGRAGYYVDSVSSAALDVPILEPLNATLTLGVFRPLGPEASDDMSEIINVLVRNNESGDPSVIGVDYELVPDGTSDQDYETQTGSQDYGFQVLNYINHGLTITSSLDGVSSFQTVTPALVSFNKAARYYSCSTVGIWHIIEITALNVGESFHIQTLEITATNAGRML